MSSKGTDRRLGEVRQRSQHARHDAQRQALQSPSLVEQVAERQEGQEVEEVVQKLRLRIPGLEDEIPERHDEDEIRRRQRRQVAREQEAQHDEHRQRQPDVPPFRHDEVVGIRHAGIVEDRQVGRVERHDVPPQHPVRPITVPVVVVGLGHGEKPALVSAGLEPVDALRVGARARDIEPPQRRQQHQPRDKPAAGWAWWRHGGLACGLRCHVAALPAREHSAIAPLVPGRRGRDGGGRVIRRPASAI